MHITLISVMCDVIIISRCVCVCPGPVVAAQDATEEEEAVDEDGADDVMAEDEDDEAEVEDDENTELVRERTLTCRRLALVKMLMLSSLLLSD